MCFCNIEKLDHDEELVVPNRPRLSSSSQIISGHNLYTLPPRLEPFGAVKSYSRPRTVELRRSVSQDRVVVFETVTPPSSGSMVRRRPFSFTEGPLPKDLQREARSLSIAESNSQLGLQIIHAKSPRQLNGMVAAITPRQSSSVVHPLTRSGRQLNASHHSPRQSATTIRSAYHPSQKEKIVETDEESSSSSSTREYGRRDKPRK